MAFIQHDIFLRGLYGNTHAHAQNGSSLLLCLFNQGWTDFAVTFPQKQKTCCGCEGAVSARHLPAAPGQPGRRGESPDRCWMAAGEEKDTADKRINYFINFISQLTLHATFQVSQTEEDEHCRDSGAGYSSSTEEKKKL